MLRNLTACTLLALGCSYVMAAPGASFVTKIGILDAAVGPSDGVVFRVRVLDENRQPIALLLEHFETGTGLKNLRRDLSAFAGQTIWLQLEADAGPAKNPQWDWAIWSRPKVVGGDGKTILDLRAALDQAEVGYILDGAETLVGHGVQWNIRPEGKDKGICVWSGEHLPEEFHTVVEDVFKVNGRSVLNSVLYTHPIWETPGTTFVRYRIEIPKGAAPMPEVFEPEFIPSGFQGEINDAILKTDTASAAAPVEDVDLVAMARWAMHYLINNPSPERNYETRFALMPLNDPPSPRLHDEDGIAFGDTENRMDWEFIYMREMTGSEAGREVEDAIWQRILGYIRDDGLSWVRSDLLCWGDPDGPIPTAMNWTTGETMVSLVERYCRDGNPDDLRLAKKLFQGLRSIATWDTGRAYYEGGLDGMRDGKWIGSPCQEQYSSILEPIVRYWEVSQDPEALEFARAWAEGQVATLQKTNGACKILPDGSFGGFNSHLHLRPTWGVAHLGALDKNPRYILWARNVYEYLRSIGTDWGWFPESPEHNRVFSETCNTADMTDTALWLARSGLSEYWDHVERYVRNYLTAAQWWVTPEYEALYRKAYPAMSDAEIKERMDLMRRLDGGFHACLTPNDWAWGDTPGCMNMMGCCPPEGMRMLHTAWKNTVIETDRGIEVNLSFNGDHPAAKVISSLPFEGRLTVIAKKSGKFLLRPPSWTDRSKVQAFLNGQPVEARWNLDQVEFNVQTGAELAITYPLVEFRQTQRIIDVDYTYHWLGNTVLGVEPVGRFLPIFQQVPRPLPAVK